MSAQSLTLVDLHRRGALIVNADDWGRDRDTTDRTMDCIVRGSVSSVSAMVFMSDSERSADAARTSNIDAGLHLNFTTPFSGPRVSAALLTHQERLTCFLRRGRYSQLVFNPRLGSSFEYVTSAQLDEFERLYGRAADRIDGHHHMHLCANVILGRLMPGGTVVRRNFTFQAGEKGLINRSYRRLVDAVLARRHGIADFLFTLPPLEQPERLRRIFALARTYVVELEVHPVIPQEYDFLVGGEMFRQLGEVPVENGFVARTRLRGPRFYNKSSGD